MLQLTDGTIFHTPTFEGPELRYKPKGNNMNQTQKMYSIRDSKGDVFHPPFYKNTHGEAERDFKRLITDEKSMIYQYPEDFDLYYIGEYDSQKGTIKALETPQHIVKAIALKN